MNDTGRRCRASSSSDIDSSPEFHYYKARDMAMKNILRVFSILFTSLVPFSAIADAGPPIPVPEISLTEAVELTKDYFVSKETRNIDGKDFKKNEYILISAIYSNYFQEKYEKEWAWRIKFTHPVQNDHSVVYKVTNQKQVIFIYATE